MRLYPLVLLVCACDVELKAIDLKKEGEVGSVSGGGCKKPSAEADPFSFMDIVVTGDDYKEKAGGGCVESVEDLIFVGKITGLDPGDDCEQGEGIYGTLTLSGLRLHSDEGPADVTLTCTSATANVEKPDELKVAAEGCVNENKAMLTEWLRQAVNASADTIRFYAIGGCPDGSCFKIKFEVNVRFDRPTIRPAGGCTPKKAPLL